jgi:hypothetical protein
MAIFLTGVGANSFKVTYAGADLTADVRSVTINQTFDNVEVTAMGAVAKAYIPGLRDDSIDVELYQDYAALKTDPTIYPYLGSPSGATLIISTSGSTVSTTQPQYTLIGSPYTYNPVDGQVGAASMTKVTFRPAAGQYINRVTTGTP